MANIGLFYLFYYLNRHKKIVLTYHNIIPDHLFDNSTHLGMSHIESIFENQIRLIKQKVNYEHVMITFDDGYKNQYQIASKILEKHGLRGTFFVTFQLIENQTPLTIDTVMQWISYVPAGSYKVIGTQFNITTENRHQIASIIYEKLLSNYTLWDDIEKELDQAFSFNQLKMNSELKRLRFDAMQKSDLLSLISKGHTVAAHSWDHRPLATLPIEIQKQDFLLCKTYAEQYCNSRLYSYPYGTKKEISRDTIRLCKKYNFVSAYTNLPWLAWKNEEVDYQLPRISLPNYNNSYLLDAKLSGFEFFCKMLIEYLLKFFGTAWWKKKILLSG